MRKSISSRAVASVFKDAIAELRHNIRGEYSSNKDYQESIFIPYDYDENYYVIGIHKEYSKERSIDIIVLETDYKPNSVSKKIISESVNWFDAFDNMPVYVKIRNRLFSIIDVNCGLMWGREGVSGTLYIQESAVSPPVRIPATSSSILLHFFRSYDFSESDEYYVCSDFESANKLMRELAEPYKDLMPIPGPTSNSYASEGDKRQCYIGLYRMSDFKPAEPDPLPIYNLI